MSARNLMTYAAIAVLAWWIWRHRTGRGSASTMAAASGAAIGAPTSPAPAPTVQAPSITWAPTPDPLPISARMSSEALAVSRQSAALGLPGGDLAFIADNPYWTQTGYFGDAAQVAAQVAGHAQAAGAPTGILGPEFYTQDPATGPVWTPPPAWNQVAAWQQDWQNYLDTTGRFLPADQLDAAFADFKAKHPGFTY